MPKWRVWFTFMRKFPKKLRKENVRVEEIDRKISKEMIEKNHYSHKFPQAVKKTYGCYYRNELMGTIVFSVPANRFSLTSAIENFDQKSGLELSRMWTDDRCPFNFESCCIGIGIKLIQNDLPEVRALVSYADTQFGHVGTIYKATNWVYLGKTKPERRYLKKDGKLLTRRSLGRKKGETERESREKLLSEGGVEFLSKPKHKYVFLLDKTLELKPKNF